MERPDSIDNPQNFDVLGISMEDYYQNGSSDEIAITLNGMPDDPMPVDVFFREPADFGELEILAMDQCRGRILDLGAGAGCHSLYLQGLGFDVVALEHSEKACGIMRQRGVRNVVQEDFYDWEPKTRFDTILLMMNGFGMCERSHKAVDFLERLGGLLEPGGQIIGDSTDISYMEETWEKKAESYVGDVRFELMWREYTQRFDWVYFDEGFLLKAGSSAGLKTNVLSRGASQNFLVQLVR